MADNVPKHLATNERDSPLRWLGDTSERGVPGCAGGGAVVGGDVAPTRVFLGIDSCLKKKKKLNEVTGNVVVSD